MAHPALDSKIDEISYGFLGEARGGSENIPCAVMLSEDDHGV